MGTYSKGACLQNRFLGGDFFEGDLFGGRGLFEGLRNMESDDMSQLVLRIYRIAEDLNYQ